MWRNLITCIVIGLISSCCCNYESIRLPNIMLILTDDQDVLLDGMTPMENVNKLLGKAGVTFTNAFTTSPLCCPSRATLLTGLYAHNHHTTNNSLNGGCYGSHWREKMEPMALPRQLQHVGYNTFFAGKYLNQYKGQEVPPGWNDFHGLHGNSRYFNYTLRENTQNITYYSQYLTDQLLNLSIKFLNSHANRHTEEPFFAFISVPAPHTPFTPAERHRNVFSGIKAPRTPNFNYVPGPLEKHWLVSSSREIPPNTLRTMDQYFQHRWESLLSVDELVATLHAHLEALHQLENTYIVYASDNGYHIGQFAQPFDKRQPYETDIRIPLIIRGPKIPQGAITTAPVSLLDLMPTMLEWAQVPNPTHLDGQSINAFLANAAGYDALSDRYYRRILLVEHWGEGNDETYNDACPWQRSDHLEQCTPEADCHCQDASNNTYACVRHFQYDINRLYCEFNDEENFVEGYDVDVDPFQITNQGYEWLPIERALYSLALANLTHCSGSSCRDIYI